MKVGAPGRLGGLETCRIVAGGWASITRTAYGGWTAENRAGRRSAGRRRRRGEVDGQAQFRLCNRGKGF